MQIIVECLVKVPRCSFILNVCLSRLIHLKCFFLFPLSYQFNLLYSNPFNMESEPLWSCGPQLLNHFGYSSAVVRLNHDHFEAVVYRSFSRHLATLWCFPNPSLALESLPHYEYVVHSSVSQSEVLKLPRLEPHLYLFCPEKWQGVNEILCICKSFFCMMSEWMALTFVVRIEVFNSESMSPTIFNVIRINCRAVWTLKHLMYIVFISLLIRSIFILGNKLEKILIHVYVLKQKDIYNQGKIHLAPPKLWEY